jgi:hypothetical protein
MKNETHADPSARRQGRAVALRACGIALAVGIPCAALVPMQDSASQDGRSLEETRVTMSKWIETQQIIGRERNDWTQGKEILKGRIDLIGKEVSGLDEKIKQAEASVTESNKKRDELVADREQLKAATAQLVASVTAMEAEVKKLSKLLPDPVRTKLQPLFVRVPEDPAATKVSVAERFQNVLGILNELNKANSEITVSFEVHKLADGSSAEVQAIYVGLAQAYFVSPTGEAGIGRPTADGWKWEPAAGAANQVLSALEILQGKQSPAFVPLPVKIQ